MYFTCLPADTCSVPCLSVRSDIGVRCGGQFDLLGDDNKDSRVRTASRVSFGGCSISGMCDLLVDGVLHERVASSSDELDEDDKEDDELINSGVM